MFRLLVSAGILTVLILPAWSDPIVLNPGFESDVLGSPFIGDATTVPDWTYTVGPSGGVTLPHWAVGYTDGGGTVTTMAAIVGQGNGGSFSVRWWDSVIWFRQWYFFIVLSGR